MSNYMHKIKAQIGCVFTVCLFITIALYGERTWAQNTPSQISDERAHEIVALGTPEEVKSLLQSGYNVNKVYECNYRNKKRCLWNPYETSSRICIRKD